MTVQINIVFPNGTMQVITVKDVPRVGEWIISDPERLTTGATVRSVVHLPLVTGNQIVSPLVLVSEETATYLEVHRTDGQIDNVRGVLG